MEKTAPFDTDTETRVQHMSQTFEQLFDTANRLMEAEEFDQAIEAFTEALQFRSDAPEVYYNRGNAYLALMDIEPALTDYNKAVLLDPQLLGAYINRSLVHFYRENVEQAIADLDRAHALAPHNIDVLKNRTALFLNLGETEKAETEVRNLLRLAPGNEAGLYYFSHIGIETGNYTEAFSAVNELIRKKSSYPELLLLRGKILQLNQQPDEAIADFTAFLEQNPDHAIAHLERGTTLLYKNQLVPGIQDLRKACELNPEIRSVLEEQGIPLDVLESDSQTNALFDYFLQDIESEFEQTEPNYQTFLDDFTELFEYIQAEDPSLDTEGGKLMHQGLSRLQKAIKQPDFDPHATAHWPVEFDSAARRQPTHLTLQRLVKELEVRFELYQHTLYRMADFLVQHPELANGYRLIRGDVYYELNDTDNALLDAEAAAKSSDDITRGEANILAARVHVHLGNVDRAIELYRLGIDLAPDSLQARTEYALCLHQTGHVAQALQLLRELADEGFEQAEDLLEHLTA
jgi:tetratricopeptide (TPR) repeat protein